MNGLYDCANRACAHYHDVVERPFHQDRHPRRACRQRLRLIRVRRTMADDTKRMLRARRAS